MQRHGRNAHARGAQTRSRRSSIRVGLRSFIEVGNALAEIRDRRLYRATHDTFEDYCRERWGFSDSRARQLVAASETVTTVTVDDLPAPASERVARELVPLRHDEAQMVEVWRELRTEYGDDVTPAHVKRVVGGRLGRLRRAQTARAANVAEAPFAPSGVRVEHCNLRELDIADESVDLLLTDPPYGAEWLDEWSALSAFAARMLKPSGVLVAMSGQANLPKCRLDEQLIYRWLCAFTTDGAAYRCHGHRFGSWWKPLLVYDRQYRSERRFLIRSSLRVGSPIRLSGGLCGRAGLDDSITAHTGSP